MATKSSVPQLRTVEASKPAFVHFSPDKGRHVVIDVPSGTKFDMNAVTEHFLEKVRKEIPSEYWWETRIEPGTRLWQNGEFCSQITLSLGGTLAFPGMAYPKANEFLQEAYESVSKMLVK